ncbi:Uncharacterised protein [Mycobacteroides abscessus subsp. abscessus]|nr:Uncharacterised protein [Mycobacteroides abscessus subsp. bolletii]SKT36948.1 Uncharacterised protein [Mycobacteroides abscessus subsp. abscessus]
MLIAAVTVGERHLHLTGADVCDGRDFDAAAQRDLRIVGEVGAQQLLEFGLVEHVGLRVSMRADWGACDLAQDLPPVIEQPHAGAGPGDGGELLGDAQLGQNAVDLVVQMHCPRLGVHRGPPLKEQALHAVLSQQRRGGDAGWSRADDDNRKRQLC